jgi:hypothetical protein
MEFKNDDLLNDVDLKIIDILYKNSLTPFVRVRRLVADLMGYNHDRSLLD